MKPNPITKGFFIGGIAMLFISIMFSINGTPAAELFAILGSAIVIGLLLFFHTVRTSSNRSVFARLGAIFLLCIAICLKSFNVGISPYFFLLALIAFLVWFAWSVLEEIPTSED
jgi:hypothetical protein